jgi:hypothetical protein
MILVGSVLFNSLGHPLHQVHIFWLVILYIRIKALFQYFRLKQQNVPYIYENTCIVSYLLICCQICILEEEFLLINL